MIRKNLLLIGVLGLAAISSGCESLSNTAKGGLIGGGLGAGLGAAAGGGKGAVIGGVAGTVLGGIVGNDIDQQEKRKLENRVAVAEARNPVPAPYAPPPPQAPMGIADVIQLSKEGVNEDVIINQIRSSHSTFILSNEDIRMLQANDVKARVIIEMQNRRPVTHVIREQPQVIYTRPAPAPVVIYERYPPPPTYFQGGVYIRR